MSLYKRGDVWWIYFTASHGRKIRQSAYTSDKVEAQKQHDLLRARLIQAPRSIANCNRTFMEAGERWLVEMKHKATIVDDDIILRWLNQRIGISIARFFNPHWNPTGLGIMTDWMTSLNSSAEVKLTTLPENV